MPYQSQAQQRYFHAHEAELGAQGVDVHEWDQATKRKKGGFKKLPGHVHKSVFGPQLLFVDIAKLERRTEHELEVGGGVAATGVGANEARAMHNIHRHASIGAPMSAKPYQGKVPDLKGVSDKPLRLSQATHPEGIYNIHMHSLIPARQRPAPRKGQDALRESIRQKGMDRPIHLRIWQDGTARIIDGHHRTARAAEVGIKKMPVSVTHMPGSHPKPKSITEAVEHVRRTRYQRGLTEAASLAKRGETMISAFGVEHHYEELEKGLFSEMAEHASSALGGFSRGISGNKTVGMKLARPRPGGFGASAQRGFRAGKFIRSNAKPLAIGGAIGGGGMYAVGRNH